MSESEQEPGYAQRDDDETTQPTAGGIEEAGETPAPDESEEADAAD